MSTIRGVNLGGWFVLEQWMRPELFEGVSGPDETIFCKERVHAKEILEAHWSNFITEADIIQLHHQGVNSVRVPVPWWILGDAPYHSALTHLDLLMGWCDRHHLSVLLDLHTTPGCQNGFDNGGITGQIEWDKQPEYLPLTIDRLVFYVKRYQHHVSFWGIEVVNEPHWSIPLPWLQEFYRKSYQAIRSISSCAIVFHDGFRPEDDSWQPFFTNSSMTNVYFDLHLYLCFDPKITHLDLHGLSDIAWAKRRELIASIQQFVPAIIGEWSLGMIPEKTMKGKDFFQQDLALRTAYAMQMQAFEEAYGWYFWSYTIWRPTHLGWDFKRLTQRGIIPTSFEKPVE